MQTSFSGVIQSAGETEWPIQTLLVCASAQTDITDRCGMLREGRSAIEASASRHRPQPKD
jgi:hypothetical protein